jgi:peroxiredoxin (alkyl hydroperoxide reductase subunit C)
LELDATAFGMGLRGQRFAIVVEDGIATHVAVEEPASFDVSRADSILNVL